MRTLASSCLDVESDVLALAARKMEDAGAQKAVAALELSRSAYTQEARHV